MRTRHLSSSDPVPPRPAVAQSAKGALRHRSVLLHEVTEQLDIQPDDVVVDATLGGAGHAKALAKGLGVRGLFIGFDLDSDAIKRTEQSLRDAPARVELLCENFRHMAEAVRARNISSVTKVLFDLGWSSYQLDSGRGFSFNADEPLAMTYASDTNATVTAAIVVNTWSEASLADIIYGFGEERYARRIANAIVEKRLHSPIRTARELAEVVSAAVPAGYRRGKLHPATRTFQALRIAVNDELGALKEGLQSAWDLLETDGRIAVISFHSIEDRVVKRTFLEWEKQGEGNRLTKKPLVASREEMKENPRARSAKLRVIQKISHESKNTKNKQIRPVEISGED